MGFSDLFTSLIKSRTSRSDNEFGMMNSMFKRVELINETDNIAADSANSIFQTGNHSSIAGQGGSFEQGLLGLQIKDKELDVSKIMAETKMNIYATMEESFQKILKDNIKISFSVG